MGTTAKAHESGHSADDLRQGVTAFTQDGKVSERPIENGPFDEFYVSPEQREAYGFREGERPYWCRDSEFWMPRGENVNRINQLEGPVHRGGSGARLIRTSEFDKVHLGGATAGDLVLMAVPAEVMEERQKEIDQATAADQSKMTLTDEGWEEYTNTLDRSNLDRRMRAEHQYNQSTGLIGNGSPTQGMSYAQAAAVMANRAGEVADKQEMLRNGGYHATPDLAGFERLMSGQKRLHGMGNSGFPRNPNSAVAQAARRQQAGGK